MDVQSLEADLEKAKKRLEVTQSRYDQAVDENSPNLAEYKQAKAEAEVAVALAQANQMSAAQITSRPAWESAQRAFDDARAQRNRLQNG